MDHNLTVLLLSPFSELSGNRATINRIRDGLRRQSFNCILESPESFQNKDDFNDIIKKNHVSVALGLHAYKAGKLLKDGNCPYVLILGGTDINEVSRDQHIVKTIDSAINKASGIVAFSEALNAVLRHKWPHISSERLVVIPQAVTVFPSNSFNIKEYIKTKCVTSLSCAVDQTESLPVTCDIGRIDNVEAGKMILLTFVGGIRPVKNPLLAISFFTEWISQDPVNRKHVLLVFIGKALDLGYYERFIQAISQCPGAVYIPGLPCEETHAAIRDSRLLLNTSDSEGMALTILEAMALGTPVMVRNIPGNTAIVQDGITGSVFNSVREFMDTLDKLVFDNRTAEMFGRQGAEYVNVNHNVAAEEKSYANILYKVLNN